MTSIVFFGTHDFAAIILQELISDPSVSVDLVITQPDKPVGRKKIMTPTPVKVMAQQQGLKVNQPHSLADYAFSQSFDLGVTAQYGLLIPKHILDVPANGILNVHTSLLPKYRGASPIQSALINGDTETGVTIMKMDQGLDTGPVLLQKTVSIDPDETYLELDKKLAVVGAEALLAAIPLYISGELQPHAQNDAEATTCTQLSRNDGKVEWNQSAEHIYNRYRGLTPWPGIWTTINGKRLKLLSIKPHEANIPVGEVRVQDGILLVGTRSGSIHIMELQLEGKRSMDANTFLAGNQDIDGQSLGS